MINPMSSSKKSVQETVIHFHASGPLVALVGNPNCGKTALFNLLTQSRQKVANYAGVTVERKEGSMSSASGKKIRILDLPGTYSLYPRSPDEKVTVDVLRGNAVGEKRPDAVVCVVDATNLRRGLRLVLAVQRLGLPCVLALNMTDVAEKRGYRIDEQALSQELGVPVLKTVAIQHKGHAALLHWLQQDEWHLLGEKQASSGPSSDSDDVGSTARQSAQTVLVDSSDNHESDHQRVQHILDKLNLNAMVPHELSDRIDRVVLHPVLGPLILMVVLFCIFQAVFSWAETPKGWIEAGAQWLGQQVSSMMPAGILQSLMVNGIIAGLGGVLVFMPQILILFFFILVLEESGYLPRAAFILDRLMGSVGLSGRSFIPLLSSFACAIPGIMATRTIANHRDRWVTILIAPMMTCSARLPVYALLIAAFIPSTKIAGMFELQGLVLFALYVAGILGALAVAWILKRFTSHGQVRSLMMELPNYHWPSIRNTLIGLQQRAVIFLKRVGGIILTMTVALWFLASFPTSPSDIAAGRQVPIEQSYAGQLGKAMAVIFEPIGFNWEMSIALVPGMAAREVVVSSLGTVYAISGEQEGAELSAEKTAEALQPVLAKQWSLATALSFLAWFVFAPQCISTIATVKRETGGWKMPAIMVAYLFGLAYLASFITYRIALGLGWG